MNDNSQRTSAKRLSTNWSARRRDFSRGAGGKAGVLSLGNTQINLVFRSLFRNFVLVYLISDGKKQGNMQGDLVGRSDERAAAGLQVRGGHRGP